MVVARQVEVWLRPEGKTEAHVPHSIFPYLCTVVPPKENEISTNNNTNTRAYLQFSTPTLAFTTKVPRIQAIAHHHTHHLPISEELIFWNDHYNYYASTLLLLGGGRAIDKGSHCWLMQCACRAQTHTHTAREVGEYKTYGAVKQWRQGRISQDVATHPNHKIARWQRAILGSYM